MKPYNYQILEYTTSELQARGVPFTVVVLRHEFNIHTLGIWVLQGWKERIKARSLTEVDEIEIFLKDIRLEAGERTTFRSLFERLGRLNVGPIRATVSGSCSSEDLNEVIGEFFDELQGITWQDNFDDVLSDTNGHGAHVEPNSL